MYEQTWCLVLGTVLGGWGVEGKNGNIRKRRVRALIALGTVVKVHEVRTFSER